MDVNCVQPFGSHNSPLPHQIPATPKSKSRKEPESAPTPGYDSGNDGYAMQLDDLHDEPQITYSSTEFPKCDGEEVDKLCGKYVSRDDEHTS